MADYRVVFTRSARKELENIRDDGDSVLFVFGAGRFHRLRQFPRRTPAGTILMILQQWYASARHNRQTAFTRGDRAVAAATQQPAWI